MEFDSEHQSLFHTQAKAEHDQLVQIFTQVVSAAAAETAAPRHSPVQWTIQETFALPREMLKLVITRLLCESGECELRVDQEHVQIFERGDTKIDRLPMNREVSWFEIPVTISLQFDDAGGDTTTVKVVYAAPRTMSFDKTNRNFFLAAAQAEFAKITEMVEGSAERYREYVESQQSPSVDKDYQTLGLQHDATWNDVKAAYRQLCLKYHPDALSAQNLPPHIAQLAAERFNLIAEAYQRLKENLSR